MLKPTMISLTKETVDNLLGNARIYAYLTSSLNKSYMIIQEDKLNIYFKGAKSTLCHTVELENPVPDICIEIDFNKFVNSIKKIPSDSGVQVQVTASPSRLTIHQTDGKDKISLSCKVLPIDSSEAIELLTFKESNADSFTNQVINVTQDLLDFVHAANSYMVTMDKSNSLALFNDRVLYTDRSIVLTTYTTDIIENIALDDNEFLVVPQNIFTFLQLVATENTKIILNDNKTAIFWESEDGTFWGVLALELQNLDIPTAQDLANITPDPSETQVLEIDSTILTQAVDFFKGLFEAGIRKPITVNWSKEGTKLLYHHPLTEAEKSLDYTSCTGYLDNSDIESVEFTLICDSLRILLTKIFAKENKIQLRFNHLQPTEPHGMGVELLLLQEDGSIRSKAVLVKLITA